MMDVRSHTRSCAGRLSFPRRSLLLACLVLFLVGCAASQSEATAPSQQASQAIYAYLEARTKEDVDKMVQLSCAAWEEQAHIEAVSFRGRQARLQDVTCTDNGSEGEFTLVLCQGKIMTSYGGESRELDLSHRQFKTTFDHGEWRMCGYK